MSRAVELARAAFRHLRGPHRETGFSRFGIYPHTDLESPKSSPHSSAGRPVGNNAARRGTPRSSEGSA